MSIGKNLIESEFIDKLISLGFSRELATLYLFILQHNPVKLSNIPTEKLHLLEPLALNKLILVDQDTVYSMNPKIAFKALGKKAIYERIVDLNIKDVPKVRKTEIIKFLKKCEDLGNNLQRIYNYKTPVSYDKVKIAERSDKLSLFLSDAINKAGKEILAVSKSPRLPDISIIWSSISEKLSQGIIYRRVVDFTEIEEHGLAIINRDVNELGVDLRVLDSGKITHKFYIIDERIVVIFTPLERIGEFKLGGQVIGNKLIAKRYKEIFDRLYSDSVSVKKILPIMIEIKNNTLNDVACKIGEKEAKWLEHLIDYGCFAKFPMFSHTESKKICKNLLNKGYIEMRNLPSGTVPIFPYKIDRRWLRDDRGQ